MKPIKGHPTSYQIRVAGHLPPQWVDWFEGLTITLAEDGDTLLTGPAIDQAALHGLLKKVRDLGLSLVSVCPVEPESPTTHGTDQTDQPDVQSEGDGREHENGERDQSRR